MLNASICAAGPDALTSEIERQIGPDSPVARQGALPAYVADACEVARDTNAAYVVGDVGSCFSKPVFAKARPCGCNTTTLLNLNREHHFGFDAATLDASEIPWADKLPIAFLRGAATGVINDRRQAARYHLLSRWAKTSNPRVDVGMTSLPMSTSNATRDAELKACTKAAASKQLSLRHRYLISAEGYDVATNLKWALWSRSAVIMPRPTMCSWLMEDRLQPWVHYVPVAPDFSNLTQAVDWCEEAGNAGVCERIGAAGREYMVEHRFLDVEADLGMGREVAAAAVVARRGMPFNTGARAIQIMADTFPFHAHLPLQAQPQAPHAHQGTPARPFASRVPAGNPWSLLAALVMVAASMPAGDGRSAPGGNDRHSEPGVAPGLPPLPAPGRRLYVVNQRYRRHISSATSLRFLHIPRDMADPLIPDIAAYQVTLPGRPKAPIRLTGKDRPAFVSQVVLLDTDGRQWPVLYRAYVTGRQYHRRLTDGWRPFVAHHSLETGDGILFWRLARDEREGALVMRVQVVRGEGGRGGGGA